MEQVPRERADGDRDGEAAKAKEKVRAAAIQGVVAQQQRAFASAPNVGIRNRINGEFPALSGPVRNVKHP